MDLVHTRQQFAVGQGFFHAGSIRSGEARFRYVYDCGSFARTVLKNRVKSFLHGVREKPIHHLYISHLDYDHVNGIKHLTGGTGDKTKIETVFLPYFNPVQRLASLLSAPPKDRSYNQFVTNPMRWLVKRKNIGRVVLVFGDQPGAGGQSNSATPQRPFRFDSIDSLGFNENLKLKPRFEVDDVYPSQFEFLEDDCMGTSVGFMHHSSPITINDENSERPLWLLIPYVDPIWPGIEGLRDRVIDAFSEDLLDSMARGDGDVAFRFEDEGFRRTLNRIYKEAGGVGVNATSMSLYSGPAFDGFTVSRRCVWDGFGPDWHPAECLKLSCHRSHRIGFDKVGWLGTGDAEIGTERPGSYASFKRFYGGGSDLDFLRRTSTVTLPHHGSTHNFNPALLDDIGPAIVVVSAGRRSQFGHPHGDVLERLVEDGRCFRLVHEDSSTGLIEHFQLHGDAIPLFVDP